jgi:phosphoglycerate kinase
VVAILGGAKVSDKLKVINNLLNISDKILICGGMVFTFLKANGVNIGSSLVEEEMVSEAKRLLEIGEDKIVLPIDFKCAAEFADLPPVIRTTKEGLNSMMGLDIGEQSIAIFKEELSGAGTVF